MVQPGLKGSTVLIRGAMFLRRKECSNTPFNPWTVMKWASHNMKWGETISRCTKLNYWSCFREEQNVWYSSILPSKERFFICKVCSTITANIRHTNSARIDVLTTLLSRWIPFLSFFTTTCRLNLLRRPLWLIDISRWTLHKEADFARQLGTTWSSIQQRFSGYGPAVAIIFSTQWKIHFSLPHSAAFWKKIASTLA